MASTTSSSVASVRPFSEPTFQEVFAYLASNQEVLASEFLLNPTNNFINEKRYQFLQESRGFIRNHIEILLDALNFRAAPQIVQKHFVYPDANGPIAIFVGGSSMNFFENITIPSTDIDIDLLPLVTRNNAGNISELVPIYTEEHGLTPIYKEYFDWLLDTLATILDKTKIFLPSMTPMIGKNIGENVEVYRATSYDRKLQYVPGMVTNIKLVGDRKYILAEIINDNFFSKVAVWIRNGDELERLMEFKLLKAIPNPAEYIPINNLGLYRPTRIKYISNALLTLNDRIDFLQRDVNTYNRLFDSIFILPDSTLLNREEFLRKKILTSKMRVFDLFERLYQLFTPLGPNIQTSVLLMTFFNILQKKENPNYFNPVAYNELLKFGLERFVNFQSQYFFIFMQISLNQKKLDVQKEYSNFLKLRTEDKMKNKKVGPLNKNSYAKLQEPLNSAMKMDQDFKASTRKSRDILLEQALKEDEIAKMRETAVGVRYENAVAANELGEEAKNNTTTTTTSTSSRTESPVSGRSGSPGTAANSVEEDEQDFEEERKEAEELIEVLKNSEKQSEAEVKKQYNLLLEKQKAEREARELEKARVLEEQIKAKKERERKRLEAKKERRRQEKLAKAANNALLEEAVKRSQLEALELNKQKKEVIEKAMTNQQTLNSIRADRQIFYFQESPSFYPQELYNDIYDTFANSIFEGNYFFNKGVKKSFYPTLFAYKFNDNEVNMHREDLDPKAQEISPLVMKIHVEPYYLTHFYIENEIILTSFLSLNSDLSIPFILENIETNLAILQITIQEMHSRIISYREPLELINRLNEEIVQLLTQTKDNVMKYKENIKKPEKIYAAKEKVRDLEQILKEVIGLTVRFTEFSFNKLINCKGDYLPPAPTIEEFKAVYEPLLNLHFNVKKQKRYEAHRNVTVFYFRTLQYFAACQILENIKLKNAQYELLKAKAPLVVICPFPTNYRNRITYENEKDIKIPAFHSLFTENLYTFLKAYNFTFFDKFPLLDEYCKLFPSVLQQINEAKEANRYIESQMIKMKQAAEIMLVQTESYWRHYLTFDETKKNYFIERLNLFVVPLILQNFVLNSEDEWEEIHFLVEDTELYNDDDLKMISDIKIGAWRQYHLVKFLKSKEELSISKEKTEILIKETEQKLKSFMAARDAVLKKKVYSQEVIDNYNKDISKLEGQLVGLQSNFAKFKKALTMHNLPFKAAMEFNKKDITKQILLNMPYLTDPYTKLLKKLAETPKTPPKPREIKQYTMANILGTTKEENKFGNKNASANKSGTNKNAGTNKNGSKKKSSANEGGYRSRYRKTKKNRK